MSITGKIGKIVGGLFLVGTLVSSEEQSQPYHRKIARLNDEVRMLSSTPYYYAYVGEPIGTDEPKKPSYTGWIKKSEFDALNVSSVAIPANFHGLEAEMVPPRLMYQLFRIVEVVENEDYVEVTARHVWYDNLKNYTTWEPTAETSYTAAAICRNILTNALSPVDSHVASDCTDTKLGSELDFKNKNLVEAFLDPEKGVCAQFGLSLIRNDWDFFCLKSVGYNRGFIVENGKNMLGVERTESIENLATRIAPIGKTAKGDIVWLDYNGKRYIDSQYINDYSCPLVELYDTGLQVGKDDVTAANIQAKLLEAAQKRFSEDHVDIPEVEMTIEFISLGDTEEYAQYRGLDKVYLYDIITVHDTVRGYDYTAQVVGIEHDVLTGMLRSVTIGKLTDWDGTRKIATWQVPEVNGENIRLKSIMAGSFAEGAIGSDDLQDAIIQYAHFASATVDSLNAAAITAVTANIQTIIAGKVVADSIDANAISAINAKLGVASIADAEIALANIGYAQIKDANVQNLIARDAVTDRYYIDKLAVNNAQAVYATVGELVVRASNGNYYRLDINSQGQLSPTQVTLTAGEISAGVTSDGKASIIETDLTVTDLSASNMKGITALIDKINASRIDVDELWARQAFINKLMVQDISSNTYIQSTIGNWSSSSTITQSINSLDSRISSLGYGTVYMQPEEPSHSELVPGDIWIQTQASGTWQEVYNDYSSWQEIYNNVSTWQTLGGVSIMWVWDGRRWQEQLNALDSDTFETEIAQNTQSIQLLANRMTSAEGDITTLSAQLTVASNAITAEVTRATTAEGTKYSQVSGITITSGGIDISGSQYVKIASGGYFQVTTGNFCIDTNSSTYVLWSGASTAANSSFSVKKDGTIKATSGTVGGWTLGSNNLSAGSGTSHIEIASSGTYAMWAGNASGSSAPFRLKPDGTVYLTKLIALDEQNQESEVNLRTAGLWKLGYATIKALTVSGGYCTSITLSNAINDVTTLNFRSAASLVMTGGWGGSNTFTVSNNLTAQTVTTTVTRDKTDSSIKAQFAVGDTCTVLIQDTARNKTIDTITIDASNAYTRGFNAVGFADTGSWINGDRLITLDNANSTYVSMPPTTQATWSHSWYSATLLNVSCTVGGKTYSTQFTP